MKMGRNCYMKCKDRGAEEGEKETKKKEEEEEERSRTKKIR